MRKLFGSLFVFSLLFLVGCSVNDFVKETERGKELTARVGESIYLYEKGFERGYDIFGKATELKYLGSENDKMKIQFNYYDISNYGYRAINSENLTFTDDITYRDIEIEVMEFNESKITYIIK